MKTIAKSIVEIINCDMTLQATKTSSWRKLRNGFHMKHDTPVMETFHSSTARFHTFNEYKVYFDGCYF